jgi:hypothetical protein
MAINMQGSWTVRVKSKSAAFAQRFVISGAASGNGTYAGAVATAPVTVTGNAWAITVQNDQGSGQWVASKDRITFPTVFGTNYQFDIQSDDAGGDLDFNDLILTCSTPQTIEDFIVYGNVSYYAGLCIFNPCFPYWLVIDNVTKLVAALQNPYLRVPIEKLYPDRVRAALAVPPHPLPDPPPPFRPIVVPLREPTALPPKLAQAFTLSRAPAAETKKGDAEANAPAQRTPFSAVASSRIIQTSQASAAALEFDRAAVAGIIDHIFPLCERGPLPGVVLGFQEYDRTSAELAGGAYTGTGPREDLGICATDLNGNYIFRFTRTLEQFLTEASVDVAPGENVFVAALPDVIVRLLDPTKALGYCYESAPYWNIQNLYRINVCVPKDCIGRLPTACQGANAIQAIGDIFIGAPQLDGSRIGFNNFLGPDGKITARSALTDVPPARCAAWFGQLDFFACFVDHPNVTQYTIRFKNSDDPSFRFFQETYLHPETALLGTPGYSGTVIGPFTRSVHVDGGAAVSVAVYDNIELNPAFVLTHRDRKAIFTSSLYAPVAPPPHNDLRYGPTIFRIQGYDAAGNLVAPADDTITLFIDNNCAFFDIASVSLLGASGGDCALFNLPLNNLAAPLTVQYRANQFAGFMDSYGLTVRKGNAGTGTPVHISGGQISGAYVHGDDIACNALEGTFDDVTHDGSGYVTVDIGPPGTAPFNGHWLDASQPFCTFAVNLSCAVRRTNGYLGSYPVACGTVQYFLGIQQSA